MFDLRIANRSIARFAEHIGFGLPSKAGKLEHLLATHRFNETDETVRLVERVDDGVELTYNLSEPRNHSLHREWDNRCATARNTCTSTTRRATSPASTC